VFIDIHAHVYRRPVPPINGKRPFATPGELLARHDELGIEAACLLPFASPEVYLPQSNDDIIELAENSSGRFIPFCNVDPRALNNSADAPLGDLLRYYRDCGCRGIGEVMPSLAFLDPLVLNLFKHVQDVGFPLIFDSCTQLGMGYGLYDEVGLPQLQVCLQGFPNLKILGHGPPFWAEIGQLETPGDRAGYPDYPIKEEGVVPKLLRRYENLYGDLSAGSGYNALARDPEYAVGFLNEFQDKLLFGTDICAPDQEVALVPFLVELKDTGKISEDVFRKIAKENAIKLLGL